MMTEKKYSFERAEPHLLKIAEETARTGSMVLVVVHHDIMPETSKDDDAYSFMIGGVSMCLVRSGRPGEYKKGTILFTAHSVDWGSLEIVSREEEEFGFYQSNRVCVDREEFADWCLERGIGCENLRGGVAEEVFCYDLGITDPNLLFEFRMRWL
jgi:hypothetical protein